MGLEEIEDEAKAEAEAEEVGTGWGWWWAQKGCQFVMLVLWLCFSRKMFAYFWFYN